MKAVILSGGSGQRLAPLTNTTTKQLLPVANRPTLFHILDLIKEETPVKLVCIVVSEEYGHKVREELINSEHSKYFQFDFVKSCYCARAGVRAKRSGWNFKIRCLT